MGKAPFEFVLETAPAGYALESAGPGELLEVARREFTSSEDGDLFITRLEGIPESLLRHLPPGTAAAPGAIDHLLAVIRPDLTTMLYVNECELFIQAQSARNFEAGDPVTEDDLLDIKRLRFEGVDVPAEAAIVCIFSAGWRKGLFFDVTPLPPTNQIREYDLEAVLGSYFAYLQNQTVFSLVEKEWAQLFEQGWFPFVSLPKHLSRAIIAGVRGGLAVDNHLPHVREALDILAPTFRDRWKSSAIFETHLSLLDRALERYLRNDYESATAILYPRIEGILRSIHASLSKSKRIDPKSLVASGVPDAHKAHPYSWLLPAAFRRYLEDVYFAGFVPGKPSTVSRHSVGHGVARPEDFNLKSASIALLIVDQLWALSSGIDPAP